MKNNSFLSHLTNNPTWLAGLVASGNPMGKALMETSQAQRQNELIESQSAKHRQDVQESVRAQEAEARMPESIRGLNWSNPQEAFAEMIEREVPLKLALEIMGQHANVNNQEGQLGVSQGNLDVNRAQLGIQQQELGLKQQKHAHEMQGIPNAEDSYKIEKDLRDAAAKETKNYKFVKTAVKNILSNAKHKNAISDTAMVYNFVNVLDPGNSVREGDTITIANAPGLPEQWRAKLNKARGEGGLDPVTRNEIIQSSKSILKNHHESVKNINQESQRLAKTYKVNPENVAYPLEDIEQEETNPQQDQINDLMKASGREWIK